MNDLVAPLSSSALFVAHSFCIYSEMETLIALFHATYTESVLHTQTRATLLRHLENPFLLLQTPASPQLVHLSPHPLIC